MELACQQRVGNGLMGLPLGDSHIKCAIPLLTSIGKFNAELYSSIALIDKDIFNSRRGILAVNYYPLALLIVRGFVLIYPKK